MPASRDPAVRSSLPCRDPPGHLEHVALEIRHADRSSCRDGAARPRRAASRPRGVGWQGAVAGRSACRTSAEHSCVTVHGLRYPQITDPIVGECHKHLADPAGRLQPVADRPRMSGCGIRITASPTQTEQVQSQQHPPGSLRSRPPPLATSRAVRRYRDTRPGARGSSPRACTATGSATERQTPVETKGSHGCRRKQRIAGQRV